MNDDRKNKLMNEFNAAVDGFWNAAMGYNPDKCALTDAANKVMLARDDVLEAPLAKAEKDMVQDAVHDVKSCMDDKGVQLLGSPQTSSAGTKTYKIMTPSRFDA